ncbi:hypothetical protein TWF281_007594 [Arthrobotrys megalospora]
MSDQPLLGSDKDTLSEAASPSNGPGFAARFGDKVSGKIRRWKLRHQERAPELAIDVNLSTSRPERTGENRNDQRPWTREIRRLLRRLPDCYYELFMIHRAHGYHGMPYPDNSKQKYRRAYEIGRLEREWEDSLEHRPSPDDTATRQINIHLHRIADYFDTEVDEDGNFKALSSDQTSSFKTGSLMILVEEEGKANLFNVQEGNIGNGLTNFHLHRHYNGKVFQDLCFYDGFKI